ncbi:MAG: phage holin family protein [Muribaculaceae bacterium]|nr:phage holin family protein [Muribaculaceae bacterium]MDE6332005.1 phage holin family protein [Muribaculaceae bacterium]
MSQRSSTESFKSIYATMRRFAMLHIESARLTTVEKLTLLGTTVVYGALLIILGSMALFFISIGIGHLLATTIAEHLAYLWVSLFYILLVLVLVIFKRQLILNPICRYISRLLAPKPES